MNLDDLFNEALQQYDNELPFAIYRKPGKEDLNLVKQKDKELNISSNFSESGFIFSPFDDELNSVIFPLDKSAFISATLENIPFENEPNKITKLSPVNSKPKKEHIELVKKGISSMHSNGLRKVVLSRKEEVKISNIDTSDSIIELLKKLLARYPSAFVYCWYHPKIGLWMGATPETLFSLENKTFRTMALAGTQKYQENHKTVWNEKEKEEQAIVTEYLEKSLEKIVPILMISKPTTSVAGNLVHLRSDIGGTINTRLCDVLCLIKKLHPTPAVCGFPKEEAKHFIKENEKYDREFYAGFLGEINLPNTVLNRPQNLTKSNNKSCTDLYVNLRCMKIVDDIATIYVGGGITKDSDPKAEWLETQYKAETMMQILS
ncbi:MAG: isochorismate synthase [Flavobacteriales bacterium]|nr:isochorismate synthase [Flavobacteriales bacterium]